MVMFFFLCVEYFESTTHEKFFLRVDTCEHGFVEFVLVLLGTSEAQFEEKPLAYVHDPLCAADEMVLKHMLNPHSKFWVEQAHVTYNGCRIFHGAELVDFLFPLGISSNLTEMVEADSFVMDYLVGFLKWMTLYSKQKIIDILCALCPSKVFPVSASTMDEEFVNCFLSALPYCKFRFKLDRVIPMGVAFPRILSDLKVTMVPFFSFPKSLI